MSRLWGNKKTPHTQQWAYNKLIKLISENRRTIRFVAFLVGPSGSGKTKIFESLENENQNFKYVNCGEILSHGGLSSNIIKFNNLIDDLFLRELKVLELELNHDTVLLFDNNEILSSNFPQKFFSKISFGPNIETIRIKLIFSQLTNQKYPDHKIEYNVEGKRRKNRELRIRNPNLDEILFPYNIDEKMDHSDYLNLHKINIEEVIL